MQIKSFGSRSQGYMDTSHASNKPHLACLGLLELLYVLHSFSKYLLCTEWAGAVLGTVQSVAKETDGAYASVTFPLAY